MASSNICGQLNLRKVSKIGATRCQILRLKCTNRFPLGLRPRPAGGAYSTPPGPLAVFKGPTSKGRERAGGRGWEERKGKEGREGKRGESCPQLGSLDPPVPIGSLVNFNQPSA